MHSLSPYQHSRGCRLRTCTMETITATDDLLYLLLQARDLPTRIILYVVYNLPQQQYAGGGRRSGRACMRGCVSVYKVFRMLAQRRHLIGGHLAKIVISLERCCSPILVLLGSCILDLASSIKNETAKAKNERGRACKFRLWISAIVLSLA